MSGPHLGEVGEPEESPAEQEKGEWVLRSWTLAHFCGEQVRTMLRGAWSRRRRQECQQALRRYVRSRKRQRGHRETEQRAWGQHRCRQPAAALGA